MRPAWPGLLGPLGRIAELALARAPGTVKAEEAALREEALEILARFGERLLPRMDQPAYSLSYANRRRVEIAARWRSARACCCSTSRPPA